MKKIILTLSFIFILFTSCSVDKQQENINQEKITSVIKEKNLDNQRIMYRMLSKEEKFTIWNDKITELITDNELSEEQKNLLLGLKNNMSSNVFDDSYSNDEREVFKNVIVKDFLNNAQYLFSIEFIKRNLFEIGDPVNNNNKLYVYDSITVCSCNQGSIWSCAAGVSECRGTNKCKFATDGCGFFGMFECNGNCFNY
ncbi:bacteriocin fulvocin C-related protein [Flavobacterium sp.]|uniref:bacteriocin fulvocin C-related protein n=1 Tax=Flavobacterium sp. TaxID=239 RepID=UPI003753AD09